MIVVSVVAVGLLLMALVAGHQLWIAYRPFPKAPGLSGLLLNRKDGSRVKHETYPLPKRVAVLSERHVYPFTRAVIEVTEAQIGVSYYRSYTSSRFGRPLDFVIERSQIQHLARVDGKVFVQAGKNRWTFEDWPHLFDLLVTPDPVASPTVIPRGTSTARISDGHRN